MKRIAYLDAVRALAVILIVFVHSWQPFIENPAFYSWHKSWIFSGQGWLVWQIGCVVSQWGVPLFAMLTGALMLERDYPDI